MNLLTNGLENGQCFQGELLKTLTAGTEHIFNAVLIPFLLFETN